MPILKDLTGQIFERLYVIKRVENSTHNQTQWLCECDCGYGCGNKKIILGSSLRDGDTKSCGCLHKEITSANSKLIKKHNTYDLTGEYGIGYTSKGESFYFDLEDYEKIKDYCWYIHDDYIVTNIEKNKYILMHRLVMNCPKDMDIDHKYHNKQDNRKEFLRIVTTSQNCMNKCLQSNNTSGVTGVCWHSRDEKWYVRIAVDGNVINLGYFDKIENAIQVRKEAELKYFGEYRYTGTYMGY